ncbi:hypothetical protein NC651_037813 [Populus alba x Populus x berolinensis]|nr:hypothetical protein NC651_037813 [Populus alba x Populus x berolinensis]
MGTDWSIEIDDKKYTAQEISARILQKLKRDAEAYLGTFDVSLLEIGEGVVEVRATSGDNHLGGDDWDDRVVEWLVDKFKGTSGIDLTKDKMAMQRLREAAEKAKIELSSSQSTSINLPYITVDADKNPLFLDEQLTRAEFQRITQDLLDRTRQPEEIDRMIKDAEAHAEEDRKRREEADVRNQAESLVYQTEKFIKEQREAEGGSQVPEDTLAKVDGAIAEAKSALGGTDIAAIKTAMEKLGQESQALGQAIYEATQAAGGQAGGAESGGSSGSADDVVDAEVVDDDRESK